MHIIMFSFFFRTDILFGLQNTCINNCFNFQSRFERLPHPFSNCTEGESKDMIFKKRYSVPVSLH